MVHNVWNEDKLEGMHGHRSNRSLQKTSYRLKKWNIEYFGYADTKVKNLEWELEKLQNNDTNGVRQIRGTLRIESSIGIHL